MREYKKLCAIEIPGGNVEYYFHRCNGNVETLTTWLLDDPPRVFSAEDANQQFLLIDMLIVDHTGADRLERHFVMLDDLRNFVQIVKRIRANRPWKKSYYALVKNPFREAI